MFEKVSGYIKENLIDKKRIPYIDIIVKKNHQTIYRYMDGYKCKPTGKEILYMYSCTKPITAVCTMQLLKDGKLSLEDKVSKYLPEYENVFILDENLNKVKPKNQIKIKHLLTMTAGLTYDRETLAIKKVLQQTNGKATTRQMVSAFANSPLAFEPGTDFLYSLCLDVMGVIIEVVSGLSFAQYVQQKVFNPLNMSNCTFDEKRLGGQIKECFVYQNGEYKPENLFHLMKLSENYESGGGGLIGTVEDYSIFADTLACGGVCKNGYKLLDKSHILLMSSEQVSKLSVNNSFTCIQGEDYGYGYGVRTRKKALACGVPIGEFGWDGAAGSYVLIDMKNQISISIGMNLLDWPSVFSGEHLNIVKRIYQSLFSKDLN